MFDSCSSTLYGEVRFPCALDFGQSSNTFYGISAFLKHNFYLAPRWKIIRPQWIFFFSDFPVEIFEFSFIPGCNIRWPLGTWAGCCKHYTFLFKIYKTSVKESKRLSVIDLNGPCGVDKFECRELPVVSCTCKSLYRDHAQG